MANAGACRILVVDDCGDTVEIIGTLLRVLGHETREALSGAAAIETALRFMPELVLLDLGLPDISGFSVATELRRRLGRWFYLVALTGHGSARDRQRSFQCGFDQHLVKPIDTIAMRGVLARAAAERPDER